jgi:tetratricopeptide (TPR) repeat protein
LWHRAGNAGIGRTGVPEKEETIMSYDISSIARLIAWIVVISLCLVGLFFAIKNSENPGRSLGNVIITLIISGGETWFVLKNIGQLHEGYGNYGPAFAMCISLAVYGIILSIIWTPSICDLLLGPITDLFDGGNLAPEKKPLYSMAISKRKAGHPLEAVIAFREQLARFPNDSEGTFLLAATQAEDLGDLPAAAVTLTLFCDSGEAAPKQIAAAFTQLADWHLRLAQDVESACAAWQEIIDRFPNSDLALLAQNRIAHAADSGKHLIATRDSQAIPVPEGIENLGLKAAGSFQAPEERSAAERAGAFVKHLADHPNDTEAREKLAVIYATEFHRLDMATMELRQLIEEPNHPPKEICRWLNLLATLQISSGADESIVRETLSLIVKTFPKISQAQLAARRIAQLPNEYRQLKQTPSFKLGVYEQNQGLKGKSPI